MAAKNGKLLVTSGAAQKLGLTKFPAPKKAGNAKKGSVPSGKSVSVPRHKSGGAGSAKDD